MSLVLLPRTAKLRYAKELFKYLEPYVNKAIRGTSHVQEITGKLVFQFYLYYYFGLLRKT